MFSIKTPYNLSRVSKVVNTGTSPLFYSKNPNDPNNTVTDSSDIQINGQVVSGRNVGDDMSRKLKLTYEKYDPLLNPLP